MTGNFRRGFLYTFIRFITKDWVSTKLFLYLINGEFSKLWQSLFCIIKIKITSEEFFLRIYFARNFGNLAFAIKNEYKPKAAGIVEEY